MNFSSEIAEPVTGTADPVLRLSGITKTFPGVRALSGVELALYPGQVTALVGENGAGKSTLVKILTGIYQPDEGSIVVDGAEARFPTATAAAHAGVTAIHQETVLFDDLSVAENIFLGHAPRGRFGLIDWTRMYADATEILTRIGARLDARTPLRELGIASKHLVAIARALSIEARVVVMDEPTAALSQAEIEELYDLVDRLKAEGKAILFISHKFDEIFRIADRYTVFRDGEMVDAGMIGDITENALVEKMVGRSVDTIFPERIRALVRRSSPSRVIPIRPNSRTSISSCAGARSSVSMAWSGQGGRNSCRRCSVSPNPRRVLCGSTARSP